MTQLLAAAGPYSLTKTWYVDGTATDVGDVTVGIVDGNGDTVVAAGTATTNNADGTYTYSLADQADPELLTVTWTRTDTGADLVDNMELVGGWLFTEAQARRFRGKDDAAAAVIPLNSATEYTDATLAEERQRITDDLEYWTGRGWIPRYARVEMSGTGTRVVDLADGYPRTSTGGPLHRPGRTNDINRVLSATVGGTAVTLTDIKVDGQQLYRTDGVWTAATASDPFNVVIEYVYGMPAIVDGVDRIALKELVSRLVPSPFSDRMLSATSEFGTVRYVQPGGPMRNVSQLPEVNAWVQAHDYRIMLG